MKKIFYLTTISLLLATIVTGCSGTSNTKSYKLGSFTVSLEGNQPGLSVTDQYGRTILPGIQSDTIEFGSGIPHVKEILGSFVITETASWIKPDAFDIILSNPDELAIKVSSSSGDGYIVLAPLNNNMLGINITAPSGSSVNRIMLKFACNDNDHFYGLGEQFNSFDQRGNIVGIWTQDPGFLQDVPFTKWFLAAFKLHPTYFPEPFMLTSKPAGILISSTAYSKFDLCSTNPQQVSIELWSKLMRIILISDKDPIHIIQDFTGIVGRQPLSPPWVIGPWISIEGGSSVLLAAAKKLRLKHIPSSALWYQDWVGGFKVGKDYDQPYHWTPDFSLYPDMASVNMTLNSMGFKALAYFNSFVDSSLDQWSTAVNSGYLITRSAGVPYTFTGVHFTPNSMVDLTNPAAKKWMQSFMNTAVTLGFSGWMADYGEWLPYDSYMKAGPAATLHNEYPVIWAKSNYHVMSSAIPSGDFVFFMRAGYLGSQPYQPVIWAGDQNTDFDSYFGMPTVIPAALNMGVSGVPIFTHDIAGYATLSNPPSTKELYYRWTELGCFTPVMRTHSGYALYTNWNWNKDSETIQMFKKYAELHVALFPYIYTYMKEAHERGTPIMQALWLEFYNDPKTATIDNEYLFGSEILVAPVIIKGAVQKTLYLPKSNWYPFDGGSAVAGGISITVQAPIDFIPVFVHAGSIIPMLTHVPDTLTSAGTPTITTLAGVITDQTLRIYPGADGSFTVYDGSVFTLTSSSAGLNPGQGIVLTNRNGQPLDPCSAPDQGAVACGMIGNIPFEVNADAGGKSVFTLKGIPSNPKTIYRIEVF